MIHHGRRAFSLATLTIPLVIAASTLNAQDSSQTKPLSTAQQVLDRYVTAIGGHDVIYKHESMTIRERLTFRKKAPVWIESLITKAVSFCIRSMCRTKAPIRRRTTGKSRGR